MAAATGLLTIARGTLPLALFGAAGYGLRTGILAAPARILQGGAPLLFGLVLDRAGPLGRCCCRARSPPRRFWRCFCCRRRGDGPPLEC